MPKEGKNLFQSLGINGSPLLGGAPEGMDPNSFGGIMGNPMMRFGMGMLKRSGQGGSFGQHLSGAVDDVGSGYEQDEMRAYRRQQMEMMRQQQQHAMQTLQGLSGQGQAPGGAPTGSAGGMPAGAKMPSPVQINPVGGVPTGQPPQPSPYVGPSGYDPRGYSRAKMPRGPVF